MKLTLLLVPSCNRHLMQLRVRSGQILKLSAGALRFCGIFSLDGFFFKVVCGSGVGLSLLFAEAGVGVDRSEPLPVASVRPRPIGLPRFFAAMGVAGAAISSCGAFRVRYFSFSHI